MAESALQWTLFLFTQYAASLMTWLGLQNSGCLVLQQHIVAAQGHDCVAELHMFDYVIILHQNASMDGDTRHGGSQILGPIHAWTSVYLARRLRSCDCLIQGHGTKLHPAYLDVQTLHQIVLNLSAKQKKMLSDSTATSSAIQKSVLNYSKHLDALRNALNPESISPIPSSHCK